MAITSTGSGDWNSTTADAPWPGGTVPTDADDVTIASGHIVTIDAIGCVANSLTINGDINVVTTVSSDITTNKYIKVMATGNYVCDLSADPAITHRIYLNKNALTGQKTDSNFFIYKSGACSLTGYTRKRLSKLTTALVGGTSESASVVDASGWQVGDEIVFATTQDYDGTRKDDKVELTGVSGNDITWTGAVTYDHAIDGYVGNISSNVSIQPETVGNQGCVFYDFSSTSVIGNKDFDHVSFVGLYSSHYQLRSQITCSINRPSIVDVKFNLNNCTFENSLGGGFRIYSADKSYPGVFANNIFYAEIQSTSPYRRCIDTDDAYLDINQLGILGDHSGLVACIKTAGEGVSFTDSTISGSNGAAIYAASGFAVSISNCDIFSNQKSLRIDSADVSVSNTDLGKFADDYTLFFGGGLCKASFTDCTINYNIDKFLDLSNARDDSVIEFINKNQNTTLQEIYTPYSEMFRENVLLNRSSSSISFEPIRLDTLCVREQKILCANGSMIRVVGYIQVDSTFYNSGTWEAPTVTLTGLDEADVVFTASSASENAWELYDISITNNSGIDGTFSLVYSAEASTVLGGKVYFDGVPDAPFITKCRHYEFVLDESNPTRKIDTLIEVIESVAIAYTGVAIAKVTETISFSAGDVDTYQKFYDYTKAFLCINLDCSDPYTRAGSQFSLNDGWTVVEPTLDNTWNGGTIQWDVADTKAGSFSDNVFDFTSTGTFDFGSASFAGTIELINTSGGVVTVALPSGTSYTNTGPDITVEVATISYTLTITNIPVGAEYRLYIKDNTPGIIGTVELAGAESHTGGDVSYTITESNTVMLQVIETGYLEWLEQFDIGTTSLTKNIILEEDTNL